jgi:hypothetical protein
MRLKSLLVLVFALALAGCQTILYKDGKRVASFAGDMTDSRIEISETGAVSWSAAKVSHSAATRATGVAVTKGVAATGVAASAVVTPKYFK